MAHQQQAEESGWRISSRVPDVWASAPGAYRVVHGLPTEGGQLSFHFPASPHSAYSKLIGKPGLAAIVTLDRNTHHILGVKFLHRPGA